MGAPCSPAGELLGPSSCHQPGAAPGCLSAAGCHRVLWVRAFQTEALRWSVTGFLAGPREALVLGCTFLCGGSSKGRPQCSEWTANSWKLAISPNFRTHVCICQRNIQIQYRPAKNVDLVSRQMAAQRDQGLGHAFHTLPPTIDVQEAGGQQQATTARFAAFKAQGC